MKQPKYNIGDTVHTLQVTEKGWKVVLIDINIIWEVRTWRGRGGEPACYCYADKNEGEEIKWLHESNLFPTKQDLINSL